jgi:uncharacterized membrane protein
MVGEEFGWVALDGWTIMLLILEMFVFILIPGFLLCLALFPKRKAFSMSERVALSLGLGLTPPFLLTLLNTTLEVKVNFVSALLVFLISCIIGILVFLKRGGNLNLISWYKSKD